MADLEALLNTPADEVEAPKPLPAGSYRATVVDYQNVKSAQKGTDGIEFKFKVIEPQDDVDQDALAAFKDAGGEVGGREMTTTQYITTNSLFMLKEFLVNLGITVEGRTLAAAIDDVKGAEAIIEVTQAISKTTNRPYAQIKSVRKA